MSGEKLVGIRIFLRNLVGKLAVRTFYQEFFEVLLTPWSFDGCVSDFCRCVFSCFTMYNIDDSRRLISQKELT